MNRLHIRDHYGPYPVGHPPDLPHARDCSICYPFLHLIYGLVAIAAWCLLGLWLLSLFTTSADAATPAPDCRARPTWCVDGYTCEPTSCTTRSTVALERLGAQLVAARAQRPRWFRPFLEGGVTWSVLEQEPGGYAAAGVHLWRLEAAVEITQDEVLIRTGFRREW